MALLPAIIQWCKIGSMIWIDGGDELFMLALGSQAYFNHSSYLSDPVLASGGTSLFRQLPLLPGVWMAWALDLGPLGIDGCWRILAGVSLPVTWYLLIRHCGPKPWVAAALTWILLVDCGLLGAGVIVRQAQAFFRMCTQGEHFLKEDFWHAEWRVATPALTMAFLLLHLWLMCRARRSPGRAAIALSGASFGLLFHVYPYFWTAASAALALALLIDRGHRNVYVWTALIGGAIGSYRIYWDMMLKRGTAADWLVRSDKFVQVSRLSDLKPPLVATLVLALGLVWIWRQRRDLIYLWTMALSGYLLFKHHVITGLRHRELSLALCLGPLLFALDAAHDRFGAAGARTMGPGCVREPDGHQPGRRRHGVLAPGRRVASRKCRAEPCPKLGRLPGAGIDSGARSFIPNATVAGDHDFIDCASILENQRPLNNYWVFLSPRITDAEWYRRIALNALLLGQDPAAFQADQARGFLNKLRWGPWTRAADGERRREALLAAYDRVARDLGAALSEFGIHYVGLRAEQPAPSYLSQDRWARLQEGPVWQIWERVSSPPP